jgi:hypothetical protein
MTAPHPDPRDGLVCGRACCIDARPDRPASRETWMRIARDGWHVIRALQQERDSWRCVAQAAIHQLHDQHVELTRLRARKTDDSGDQP